MNRYQLANELHAIATFMAMARIDEPDITRLQTSYNLLRDTVFNQLGMHTDDTKNKHVHEALGRLATLAPIISSAEVADRSTYVVRFVSASAIPHPYATYLRGTRGVPADQELEGVEVSESAIEQEEEPILVQHPTPPERKSVLTFEVITVEPQFSWRFHVDHREAYSTDTVLENVVSEFNNSVRGMFLRHNYLPPKSTRDSGLVQSQFNEGAKPSNRFTLPDPLTEQILGSFRGSEFGDILTQQMEYPLLPQGVDVGFFMPVHVHRNTLLRMAEMAKIGAPVAGADYCLHQVQVG